MILKAKMTMLLAFGLALSGCGTFDRDNPLDPASGEFVGDLETALIGTWSMVSGAENQVYVFKSNGSVDLVDYSSPSGGTVDRNASYPATRISRFSGTYALGGNLLRITFTSSLTNEPGAEDPTLPPSGKVSEVRLTRSSLILKDATGERTFTRI